MDVKNATIEGTNLGVQYTDHGILSFRIFLNYGGSGQGFGGIVLDDVNPEYTAWLDSREGIIPESTRVPTILASSLLLGINSVFKCDWEKLTGVSCRAYGGSGKVVGIGHFLEDKWLWLKDCGDNKVEFVVSLFNEMQKELNSDN